VSAASCSGVASGFVHSMGAHAAQASTSVAIQGLRMLG